MTARRDGFALLAALWITMALSAMALTGLLVARDVVNGSENRIALMRGRWRAEDCVERARAVTDDALADGQAMPRPVAGGWEALDRVVLASPAIVEVHCDVSLVPVGTAVDVNGADGEQLRVLLKAVGVAEAPADSMVDALLDWRDADDVPRPFGAERAWYQAVGRFPPRNGPLADIRELRRVRGFDALPDSILYTVFTVEPGRIVWNRAPLAVLASVPGIGSDIVDRVAQLRRQERRQFTLEDLTSTFGGGPRGLDAQSGDFQRYFTDRPDAWILTARAGLATIEVRLAPAGPRAAIVRRRSMP